MQSTAKYVVCPRIIRSKSDGQFHYIGAAQLMSLYRVDPRECEIYEPSQQWTRADYEDAENRVRGLPQLIPRFHGDYEEYKRKLDSEQGDTNE